MPAKNNHLVISALGKDKPGIVDKLARAIYELDCNISDSRMTVLGGEFAIILLVEGPWNLLAKLEDQVPDLQERLGLTITVQQTEERSKRQSAAIRRRRGGTRPPGDRAQPGQFLL
jgi:glycine cleavage system transcriptional repressor